MWGRTIEKFKQRRKDNQSYPAFIKQLSVNAPKLSEKPKPKTEAGIIKCPKEITIVCQNCGYKYTHQFESTAKVAWHKELELIRCPQCGGK